MSSLPIAGMLNQTCYISRYTGEHSIIGDEIYSEPEQVQCRIDRSVKQTYNRDGVSVTGIATVYFDTDITDHDWIYIDAYIEENQVTPNITFNQSLFNYSKVVDSGDYEEKLVYGNGRKPIQVNHLYDGQGAFSHCEVVI